MINVVDKQVNTKLIGGGGQNSNLTKLNNNINNLNRRKIPCQTLRQNS